MKKKILDINLNCPLCASKSLAYGYVGEHNNYMVYCYCLCCGLDSEMFSEKKHGSVQAHIYACNFISNTEDMTQYEMPYDLRYPFK